LYEREATVEQFAGDESPGDSLSIPADIISRSHPDDEVFRALVNCQAMLDRGLEAQFQVPDIQFLDYHFRPQREI
jgi:hypothetical protein